jgi:hypothetical protein
MNADPELLPDERSLESDERMICGGKMQALHQGRVDRSQSGNPVEVG